MHTADARDDLQIPVAAADQLTQLVFFVLDVISGLRLNLSVSEASMDACMQFDLAQRTPDGAPP